MGQWSGTRAASMNVPLRVRESVSGLAGPELSNRLLDGVFELRSFAAKQRPRPPPMSARLPWSRSTVTDPPVGRKKDSTPRISMLHLGVCPTYGAMVGYEGGLDERLATSAGIRQRSRRAQALKPAPGRRFRASFCLGERAVELAAEGGTPTRSRSTVTDPPVGRKIARRTGF